MNNRDGSSNVSFVRHILFVGAFAINEIAKNLSNGLRAYQEVNTLFVIMRMHVGGTMRAVGRWFISELDLRCGLIARRPCKLSRNKGIIIGKR